MRAEDWDPILDWAIRQGLHMPSVIAFASRVMQADVTSAGERRRWYEEQQVKLEERLTAIEESTGEPRPPEAEPDEEARHKRFMDYVKGSE